MTAICHSIRHSNHHQGVKPIILSTSIRQIALLFMPILLILLSPNNTRAATVITTLPPLAGLVQWLDADVEVRCLLPSNADPHHFQLTPRQVESLQNNQLLIRSSRDDGHWPGLNTSIPTLDLWPLPEQYTHTEHHADHDQHNHAVINHQWLNPLAVRKILPILAKQLSLSFPKHQAQIDKQLHIALSQTDAMWQQWQQLAQTLHWQAQGIMMQHPSWQALFSALDIPIRAILESEQHGHEQGPKKLEHALSILQKQPQTLLIGDINHSNRTLQWLQTHHRHSTIINLNALGTCGDSWIELMQDNIDTIKAI